MNHITYCSCSQAFEITKLATIAAHLRMSVATTQQDFVFGGLKQLLPLKSQVLDLSAQLTLVFTVVWSAVLVTFIDRGIAVEGVGVTDLVALVMVVVVVGLAIVVEDRVVVLVVVVVDGVMR